jgi:hypothetical protein
MGKNPHICFCRCRCFCFPRHPHAAKNSTSTAFSTNLKVYWDGRGFPDAPGATDEQEQTSQPAPPPIQRGERIVAKVSKSIHHSSGLSRYTNSHRTTASLNKHSPTPSPSHRRARPSANHGPPQHHHSAPRPIRQPRRTQRRQLRRVQSQSPPRSPRLAPPE